MLEPAGMYVSVVITGWWTQQKSNTTVTKQSLHPDGGPQATGSVQDSVILPTLIEPDTIDSTSLPPFFGFFELTQLPTYMWRQPLTASTCPILDLNMLGRLIGWHVWISDILARLCHRCTNNYRVFGLSMADVSSRSVSLYAYYRSISVCGPWWWWFSQRLNFISIDDVAFVSKALFMLWKQRHPNLETSVARTSRWSTDSYWFLQHWADRAVHISSVIHPSQKSSCRGGKVKPLE